MAEGSVLDRHIPGGRLNDKGQIEMPLANGELEAHELAGIFPLVEGEEFLSLVDDIWEHGLRNPIVLYEGKILDGRNRYNACREAGVEPHFAAYDGDDPLGEVISLNVKRRHLNESQRAMVAARLSNMQQGARTDLASIEAMSQPEAAKLLSVARSSVQRAKFVFDNGVPELVAAVQRGTIPVSRAAGIAKELPEKQRAICARLAGLSGKDALKKAVQAVNHDTQNSVPSDLPRASDRYRLIVSDINDLDIDAESVDVIVCDPPYPKEYLDTFKWLAEKAEAWLKPGGSLVVMSGQSWLPEVLSRLSSGSLRYHWTFAYMTPGGQAVQMFDRKVNTFWKPVFWFVKGDYSGQWVGDVASSKVNDNDKRFHGWGQSESGMADLIGRVSIPGQVILDPFCGGGTTGVVAVTMNRIFIGADVSADAVETTARRLKEASDASV